MRVSGLHVLAFDLVTCLFERDVLTIEEKLRFVRNDCEVF